jgi:predicted RNase H-like HicB family nuclease
MSQSYLAVYEHTRDGFSGFIPDLPGCICSAETLDEMGRVMQQTVNAHLRSLEANDVEVPQSKTTRIEFPISSTIDYWVVELMEPRVADLQTPILQETQLKKTCKSHGRLS